MYTEQDRDRMQAWDSIASALLAAYTLYAAKLGCDSQADKPTFDAQLHFLIETAQAQTKLWRNPETAETVKLERDHNIYSL